MTAITIVMDLQLSSNEWNSWSKVSSRQEESYQYPDMGVG